MLDQRLVVRRDRGEASGRERALDQPRVGRVDVLLLGVRDRLRLEVGALDEAEVRLELEQRLEIGRRAVEVGLQHRADVLVALLAEAAVDAQRRVDVERLLHVEPDEVAAGGGVRDELADVRARELLVEGEAEVRQLQRDVDAQLLGGDAVEDLPVGVDDGAGLGLVLDALAEQGRIREQALVVEPAEHDDRLVERLARDEPRGAEPHPVPAHDALEPRALRGREDRLPQHARDSNPLLAPVVEPFERGRLAAPATAASGGVLPRRSGRRARPRGAPRRRAQALPCRRGRRPRMPRRLRGASSSASREPEAEEHVREQVDHRPADDRDELGRGQLVRGVGDHQLVPDSGDDDARDEDDVEVREGVACVVVVSSASSRRRSAIRAT